MRHVHTLALAGLILGSLVFSVGGVAIVGHAGDANPPAAAAASAPEQSSQLPADAKAKQECTPPQRHEVRAHVPKDDPSHTVVLNTRGYNYPMPNEVRPLAPARKDALPASPEQP
ncbi:MAG TPA: hypothetical protein VMR50_01215 [Myxococcota bacterium]|nr:hypothetical protein [Myxococcota bacterium]